MFGEKMNWKGWEDVKAWAEKNGFTNLVKRMQLNNDCWMSSGEFGRSQVEICDSLRYATDEDNALRMAENLDKAFSKNYGLY